MDVLRFELGLRIPEDVSVVGFDDTPPAAWPAYALTTYRQSVERMVAETVAILTADDMGPQRRSFLTEASSFAAPPAAMDLLDD